MCGRIPWNDDCSASSVIVWSTAAAALKAAEAVASWHRSERAEAHSCEGKGFRILYGVSDESVGQGKVSGPVKQSAQLFEAPKEWMEASEAKVQQ